MRIGRVLISAEQIEERLAEMGAEITADYRGKDLLLVAVLKGAFMVMADLSRHIALPVDLDFMAVSSYGEATRTSGVVRILKDLDREISGRHVLIVEDIVDSGLTLHYLRRNLEVRRPASLEIATLLLKPRSAEAAGVGALRGLRDPARLRHRVRPRLHRPLPQPALCGGHGGRRGGGRGVPPSRVRVKPGAPAPMRERCRGLTEYPPRPNTMVSPARR